MFFALSTLLGIVSTRYSIKQKVTIKLGEASQLSEEWYNWPAALDPSWPEDILAFIRINTHCSYCNRIVARLKMTT